MVIKGDVIRIKLYIYIYKFDWKIKLFLIHKINYLKIYFKILTDKKTVNEEQKSPLICSIIFGAVQTIKNPYVFPFLGTWK
jgi:hypothetical protein